jgi:hypothetical protein
MKSGSSKAYKERKSTVHSCPPLVMRNNSREAAGESVDGKYAHI